jgi:hypothetical protein
MSAYCKELLLDLAMNRLPIDLRTDLIVAIQDVINSRVFTRREIEYLDRFLQGYDSIEIAQHYLTTSDIVEQALSRIMEAIEYTSGYTDMLLYRKIQMLGKYSRSKLLTFKDFLMKHGEVFSIKEIYGT